MKKLNYCWSCVLVLALLFTSCTKDEASDVGNNTDKVALSFGAVLNDLSSNRAAAKAHLADFPVCSSADPDYVKIVLTQGGSSIVGTMAVPFKIDLVEGQLFTEDVPELELEAGIYSLDYFAVYDANNNLIWIAPKTGGSLANFVDDPLSLPIDLRKGVKKYVDVTVLCFDDRMVNEYGYLFFEINPEKAIEFCFFANYCDDRGMHYPASYSVNIWKGTDNTGAVLYSNVPNAVGQYDNGDYYANALCFALPDNDALNTPYLYYEVTLSDWPAVYGNVPQTVISGTLTKQQILDNHEGGNEVDYEHLRFNCGDNPGGGDCITDTDGDTVPDCRDECDDLQGPPSNNGCPIGDDCSLDDDGDGIKNCNDVCKDTPAGVEVDDKGCPIGEDCITDTDEDGVPDCEDLCDDVKGSPENDGCPTTGSGQCDTAWMWGDHTFTKKDDDGLSLSGKWGWAENFIVAEDGNSKIFKFYAGAGGNKISAAKEAGMVEVSTSGSTITVEVTADSDVTINKLNIYTSDKKPETASPGQFNKLDGVDGLEDTDPSSSSTNTYTFEYSGDGSFWIAVHGDICRD